MGHISVEFCLMDVRFGISDSYYPSITALNDDIKKRNFYNIRQIFQKSTILQIGQMSTDLSNSKMVIGQNDFCSNNILKLF